MLAFRDAVMTDPMPSALPFLDAVMTVRLISVSDHAFSALLFRYARSPSIAARRKKI